MINNVSLRFSSCRSAVSASEPIHAFYWLCLCSCSGYDSCQEVLSVLCSHASEWQERETTAVCLSVQLTIFEGNQLWADSRHRLMSWYHFYINSSLPCNHSKSEQTGLIRRNKQSKKISAHNTNYVNTWCDCFSLVRLNPILSEHVCPIWGERQVWSSQEGQKHGNTAEKCFSGPVQTFR